MHFKTLFSLALGTVMSLTAGAQVTNQNVRSLSLKECLNMALAHNIDIQIERYSPRIAGYHLRAAYGAYDPTLNLVAQKSFTDQPAQFNPKKYAPPPGTPIANALGQVRVDSEYELAADSVGPSLGGRLPTGFSYNMFARADHFDAKTFASAYDIASFPPGTAFPPSLTNDYYTTLGIRMSQSLLKDSWIDLTRRNIQINKKSVQISELTLRAQVMAIVTKVSTVYYDLTFAREQIEVETSALESAKRLLEDTHRKVQAGALPPLDQQQAESSVETIQTALFAARQAYAEQENNLKNLVTDQYQSWMDVVIMPSEDLSIQELPANRSVSWVNALSRRPDMQQMRLDLEIHDINLRYTYNQLFPSLEMYGSYGWQAVERGLTGSWDQIKDGKNPFYSFGVQFTIPLGNTTARNERKAAMTAKEQAVLKFKRLEYDIIYEVDTAVKLAETTFKQISSSRKARELAAAALDAIQREYEAGTKTSFFVLDYQGKLTRAKSAEIRALADYKIALAKLALSEGTTLEKNQINFQH